MAGISLSDIGTKLHHNDAKFHRETVADLLGRSQITFPGAQPVSFARRHLRELEKNNYYVAEKTDGIRCLLYLTELTGPSGQMEAQFLIDRKNDYYYIPQGYLHIPPPGRDKPFEIEAWHRGTLLDGELVRQRFPDGKEQLTYLMFDCLAVDNTCLTEKDYSKRLSKMQQVYGAWKEFAKAWPQDAEAQPFQISDKKPQLPYGAQMMFKDVIPKLPHGNDGLIFTCLSTGYISGTDQHILKWKPPHENTIDFKLRLGKFPIMRDDEGEYEDFEQIPEIELLINYGDKDHRKFANLHLTEDEWEAMKSMGQPFDGRIIECYREADTGHWRPKLDGKVPRFRDDKDDANFHKVVEAVIESIEDAVSEQDLIDAAPQIRHAWKERERKQKEAGAGV